MNIWLRCHRHLQSISALRGSGGLRAACVVVFLFTGMLLSGCAHTNTTANPATVTGSGIKATGQRFTAGIGAKAGCVRDNQTGLLWMKSPDSTMRTWDEALDYAKSLGNVCGHSDWRIPSVEELQTLVNVEAADTSAWLNETVQGFSNVQPGNYWSSVTLPKRVSIALGVNMHNGSVGNFGKTNVLYVWPVRGGQ